jgi:hypothetical protein
VEVVGCCGSSTEVVFVVHHFLFCHNSGQEEAFEPRDNPETSLHTASLDHYVDYQDDIAVRHEQRHIEFSPW